MTSKYGIYYNSQFNCLMLVFSNVNHNLIQKYKNLIILKKDKQIVAINIHDVEIKIDKAFINSGDEVVEAYIEKQVADIGIFKNQAQFLIGEITEHSFIPDTHLSHCIVDIGSEKLEIVCGAKNSRLGILVVVAVVGTWMPSGMFIAKGKLRGKISEGMLCSATELGIKDFNHEGIIELPEMYRSEIGKDFWKVR